MASKNSGRRRLPVTGLARWSGTAATAGGALFAAAALAQLLFTLRFGGSRFAESLSGIALYHSFNVPAYALFCASLAGFYLRCRSRMGLAARTAYATFFLSTGGAVIVVPGAALFGWLVLGAQAGMLEPFTRWRFRSPSAPCYSAPFSAVSRLSRRPTLRPGRRYC